MPKKLKYAEYAAFFLAIIHFFIVYRLNIIVYYEYSKLHKAYRNIKRFFVYFFLPLKSYRICIILYIFNNFLMVKNLFV